ncbi:clostripain-related cysteine peptidase [Ferruginibacter sp.]
MNYKWKVIFLIQNVGNDVISDEYLEKIIAELINLNFTDDIVVYLLFTLNDNTHLIADHLETSETLPEGLFSISIELKRNINNPNQFIKLNCYKQTNLGYKEDLITLLKDTQQKKGEKEIVVTYDHGGGLGMFPRYENFVKLVPTDKEYKEERKIEYVQNVFDFVIFDLIKKKDNYTLMPVDDFNEAFNEYSSRKIDVLVMMNCFMLMLDNCVSFRRQFKNLVAPAATIGFNGYVYQDIFDTLNEQKNIDTIINNIILSSKNIDTVSRVKNKNAILGIRLSLFGIINFIFNVALLFLNLNKEKTRSQLIKDRQLSKPWVHWGYNSDRSPFELMDFKFCLNILKSNGSIITKKLVLIIKCLLKISLYKEKNIGTDASQKDINLTGPSVLFPLNSENYKTDRIVNSYYKNKATVFSKKSLWPKFLETIFK